jgi:hypothetical protein
MAVALVLAPLLGVLAALVATPHASDEVGWLLLVGLPIVVTCSFGWALRRQIQAILVAAIPSGPIAVLGLFGFVWYLFQVNDFS